MKMNCCDQEAGDERKFDCADMMREMMEKFCQTEKVADSMISSMMTKCRDKAARCCDERSEE